LREELSPLAISLARRKGNKRIALVAIVSLLVFVFLVTLFVTGFSPKPTRYDPGVFVGMDIGYGDDNDAIKNIDKVADYANLIILGSLKVTNDTEKLTRVCDYIYQKGLNFIIYVGFAETGYTPPRGPDADFFTKAKIRWGDKFLGVYLFDEVGGKQVDRSHSVVDQASNNAEASNLYVHHLNYFLGNTTAYYDPSRFPLFTSDYALYWFDYLSGYDVVFSEFTSNNSKQLNIALNKGAAKTLSKNWGTMITWKYDGPPFLGDGEEVYNDMVLAYQNGAKYIVTFNSPANFSAMSEYGAFAPEHFEAMKRFWDYTKNHSPPERFQAETAYVLPRDYGYGFRGPSDKIWGLWEADSMSAGVWNDSAFLLAEYGMGLDIVYETSINNASVQLPYSKLIFWNGTPIEK
jgi:hypothetical protein